MSIRASLERHTWSLLLTVPRKTASASRRARFVKMPAQLQANACVVSTSARHVPSSKEATRASRRSASLLTWPVLAAPSWNTRCRTGSLLVCSRLDPVEVGVGPIAPHELVMAAYLDESRAVEDDDQIGHPHCAEPVRDQDRDGTDVTARRFAAMSRRCIAFEQCMFGLGIQRRGRLVKHHQQRHGPHVAAGERQLLPLAEAQFLTIRPGRAQLALQTFRQPFNHIGSTSPPHGVSYRGLVVEPRQISETDTVLGTELETEEVLEGAGQPAPPPRRRHPTQRP